jgi:transposase InsO family protein
MMIALHKNARTTPAIRAEIASSGDSAAALAQRFGITEATVYKWKKRTSVHDASHTPHRLQTTLTPTQERVVVELRRTLLLPLDDLLAVTREFICPNATRSGLDRCLRRHGVGNLGELKPAQPAPVSKTFKAYEPGYLHIDLKYLPQMQDESSRRYLFVAIDRATRWVFVQIKKNKTAASAKAFLNAVHKACPMRIQKVLTDNGKEFTDRLFASRARQPTGEHEFDQLCASLGIEHRLTKPRTPRTNGMVERFNGRIADVLRSHRFNSGEDLEQTLLRYAALYNHQFPQSALKSRTPLQAMKDWYAKRPDLFVKRPYDHPGCDSYFLCVSCCMRALWSAQSGFGDFACFGFWQLIQKHHAVRHHVVFQLLSTCQLQLLSGQGCTGVQHHKRFDGLTQNVIRHADHSSFAHTVHVHQGIFNFARCHLLAA